MENSDNATDKQAAEILEEITIDLLARHAEGLTTGAERTAAEAYLAVEQQAQESDKQFITDVLTELERREPDRPWLPPLSLDELPTALELSRSLRGRPFTATRYEAPGLVCGLECVCGTLYLVYETTDANAWGQFVLCSVWGTPPDQSVTPRTTQEAATPAPSLPICLTHGDEPDGIHWIRLALLDSPGSSPDAPHSYGCRVALPVIAEPDENAILMVSQPISLDLDSLTCFPDERDWYDLPLVPTLSPTRAGNMRNSPPPSGASVTDETRSVRAELRADPDGTLKLSVQCLSAHAIGQQTVIHLAFGPQSLWQTTHIFSAENETIHRTVPLPQALQEHKSNKDISLSVFVPKKENP